jgi:coenzyme F420-reducing hydrogenase gamma subunit
MSNPKVAFFDFACCEGCQLQIANLGEELLNILKHIDVVEFREVMSEKWDKAYDIAIIEGSITTEHAIERVKKIRARSKIVIAFGSCATIGGVNAIKNNLSLEKAKSYVYKNDSKNIETIKTQSLPDIIKVDYQVHGCPIYPGEFINILKSALTNIPYSVPEYSVCTDCKFNENICLYEKGTTCLGPITRAGCNAWCINNGNICYGCRGLLENANLEGFKLILDDYKITQNLQTNKVNMYNSGGENNNG